MPDAPNIIESVHLDLLSSTPLYQQLAAALRDRILTGELAVGTHLPTENALSTSLGIGVSTVRAAYGRLVDEGLVTRRPRRGSFVTRPELGRQLDGLYSFTSETRRMGALPGTHVVSFGKVEADPATRAHLGLEAGEQVFEIVRLRLADDSPIMLETSCVPVRLCPALTEADLAGSLYEALARLAGMAPAEARELHEAVALTADEAKALGRKKGDPAFRISRTTSDASGETFEFCVSLCPGDATRYEMTLRPNGTDVSKQHY